jgi:hypothetical protein
VTLLAVALVILAAWWIWGRAPGRGRGAAREQARWSRSSEWLDNLAADRERREAAIRRAARAVEQPEEVPLPDEVEAALRRAADDVKREQLDKQRKKP